MNALLLFVYGTLKRGGRRHDLLAGQEFLGTARTLPHYRLYRHPAYPCLVEDEPGNSIVGEIWRVREESLRAIDAYEGSPRLFCRRAIALAGQDDLPVHAYFYQGDVSILPECCEW